MTDPLACVPAPLLALLRDRARLVVLTGAGMSAESGVPTFRGGANGLWARYDPMTLATPEAWQVDRTLVWAWYLWRMAMVRNAQPNAGHLALRRLGSERDGCRPRLLSIVTQNVDDLHERAAAPDAPGEVLHLHGRLFASRCSDCEAPYEGTLALPSIERPPTHVTPPACARCGGAVRPGVVWFGEALPEDVLQAARRRIRDCDAAIVVGTSGLVAPASMLPLEARRFGKPVIEINPEASALSASVDYAWRTTAARGLPAIAAALGMP